MKYYEITFALTPASETASDVLSALLADIGFETFVPTPEGQLQAYIQQPLYDEQSMQALLDYFPMPDVQIAWELAVPADENWNETWENEGFQPIYVDGQLVVCDPRHDVDESLERILIHPRQAFGTGSHQTTRMLLSTLMQMPLEGWHVVDAGCGTGILGFLCLKHGATRLFAYDIDEWSVRNTQDNAQLNELDDKNIEVVLGDASVLDKQAEATASDARFDLLIANINRNILLADLPRFASVMKPNARILLSGFYTTDVPQLVEAAARFGFRPTLQRQDEEWAMLCLER